MILDIEIEEGVKLSKKINTNIIVSTIFVDKSIGEIELSKISKIDGNLTSQSENIRYRLKRHKISVKDDIIISDVISPRTICCKKSHKKIIMDIFVAEINNFKNVINIKYKQPFFRRLFNRNKENDLLSRIDELSGKYSWMIAPHNIIESIKKIKNFKQSEKDGELISPIGYINEVGVYVSNNNNIYFGNYDSITLLLKPDIEIEDIKSISFDKSGQKFTIECLFLETGEIKCLSI